MNPALRTARDKLIQMVAMKSNFDVSNFYNLQPIKFWANYLFGNSRVAVQRCFWCRAIPRSAKKIAWTESGSAEGCWDLVTRIEPEAHLTAMDISPRCIKLGELLFLHQRIVYKLADLIVELFGHRYDTILLPDVCERIPRAARAQFHANMMRIWSMKGKRLVIV